MKEKNRATSQINSRPSSASSSAKFAPTFRSPRQGHCEDLEQWEDLEGDELLVEEDEDGSSIGQHSEHLEDALLDEQMKRDPLLGGYQIDPSRPCILSGMQSKYTGGARREDLDILAPVTDVAVSNREEVGGEGWQEREGRWSATLLNGCEYDGEWHGGLMHGRGTLRFADGTIYTGDIQHGRLIGEGSLYYRSGVEYHGEVMQGERHGEGLLVIPRPRYAQYKGSWVKGKRHGRGVLRLDEEDEAYFSGEWADDRRHGRGRMVYASGNEYEGEWRHDCPHGHGTMHWKDLGEMYSGEWVDGRQHGSGEHAWYTPSHKPPTAPSSTGAPSTGVPAIPFAATSHAGQGERDRDRCRSPRRTGGQLDAAGAALLPSAYSYLYVSRNRYAGQWVRPFLLTSPHIC